MVNDKTDQRLTPLHMASQKAHLEFEETRIWSGADVNGNSESDDPPLFLTLLEIHLKIVDKIIWASADVKLKFAKRQT